MFFKFDSYKFKKHKLANLEKKMENLNDPITTRILISTFNNIKTFDFFKLQKVSCRFKRLIQEILLKKESGRILTSTVWRCLYESIQLQHNTVCVKVYTLDLRRRLLDIANTDLSASASARRALDKILHEIKAAPRLHKELSDAISRDQPYCYTRAHIRNIAAMIDDVNTDYYKSKITNMARDVASMMLNYWSPALKADIITTWAVNSLDIPDALRKHCFAWSRLYGKPHEITKELEKSSISLKNMRTTTCICLDCVWKTAAFK
jgi:hypothetical protein